MARQNDVETDIFLILDTSVSPEGCIGDAIAPERGWVS